MGWNVRPHRVSSSFKRLRWWWIGCFGWLGLTSCGSESSSSLDRGSAKVVEVYTVVPKAIEERVTLIGQVEARNAAVLTAPTDGVVQVVTPAGAAVKAGELVAQIQNPALLGQAPSFQKPVRVAAPFKGEVGVFKARTGSFVRAGHPIVSVYQRDDLMVTFGIPVRYLPHVTRGSVVALKGLESFLDNENQRFQINEMQTWVDQDSLLSPAVVYLKCARCLVGQPVDVTLVVRAADPALVVPETALFFKSGAYRLFEIDKDGQARERTVQIGIQQGGAAQIVKGLQGGERVVLVNPKRLSDGDVVSIFESP